MLKNIVTRRDERPQYRQPENGPKIYDSSVLLIVFPRSLRTLIFSMSCCICDPVGTSAML